MEHENLDLSTHFVGKDGWRVTYFHDIIGGGRALVASHPSDPKGVRPRYFESDSPGKIASELARFRTTFDEKDPAHMLMRHLVGG